MAFSVWGWIGLAAVSAVISTASLLILSRKLLVMEICMYFMAALIFTVNYFRMTESVYHFFDIAKGIQGLLVLQLEFTFVIPAILVWLVYLFIRKKLLAFFIGAVVWLLINWGVEMFNSRIGVILPKTDYAVYTLVFNAVILVCQVVFVYVYRKMLKREGFEV